VGRHRRFLQCRPGQRVLAAGDKDRYWPDGYTVTFRLFDPRASRVQIKGEWYFSSPAHTTTTSSQGLLPRQWKPGDFPIAYPNALAANWPVSAMHKNRRGVWSFTTPLPSGIFNYGFFINCTTADQTGCTEIADPSNPPWNQRRGVVAGSTEPTSQVYVPSDPAFRTVSYWWQAPRARHGRLTEHVYRSPLSQMPPGTNYLAVYTPPGYDPDRRTPYPTLYLSHGGGGNEVDWSTQGAAGNILDNLVDTGEIQPMVVVMTSFNGFGGGCGCTSWANDYDRNLVKTVFPYIQAHYNVSGKASERAFAGLSCGGFLAGSLLENYVHAFGYVAMMSGAFLAKPTASELDAMRAVGIMVGGGWQDPIHSFSVDAITALRQARVGLFPDFVNGGHEWYVWRILLRDFLTRVAFLPVVGSASRLG
jgi:enterochelin esterase-like enzyme